LARCLAAARTLPPRAPHWPESTLPPQLLAIATSSKSSSCLVTSGVAGKVTANAHSQRPAHAGRASPTQHNRNAAAVHRSKGLRPTRPRHVGKATNAHAPLEAHRVAEWQRVAEG